jgi:hypothetical protein
LGKLRKLLRAGELDRKLLIPFTNAQRNASLNIIRQAIAHAMAWERVCNVDPPVVVAARRAAIGMP